MQTDTEVHPIESRVREVLAEYGRLGCASSSLQGNASLADAGMSSLASVDVMLALESEFGEFPERMLSSSVFYSVDTITAALRELLKR